MNTRRIRPSIWAAAIWSAGLVLVAAGWPAAAAPGDDVERAAIAKERAAIDARYAARERECRARFVVTSCVDEAKVERRRGIDALRGRQLKLDEARRRERTAERRAELAAKAADDARREQERAVRAASAPPPAPQAPRSLEPRRESRPGSARDTAPRPGLDRPGAGDGPGSKPRVRESAAQRLEREARRRESFETRKRQAAEHRDGVNAKAAERSKQHAPAATLPVPASAAAR